MITDEQAEKAANFIYRSASEFAKAKAQAAYLDEFRKSKKAILMKAALTSGCEAVSAQERDALADAEYIELLEQIKIATETAETLKWQMLAAEIKTEIWRTQSANNRAIDRAHR